MKQQSTISGRENHQLIDDFMHQDQGQVARGQPPLHDDVGIMGRRRRMDGDIGRFRHGRLFFKTFINQLTGKVYKRGI